MKRTSPHISADLPPGLTSLSVQTDAKVHKWKHSGVRGQSQTTKCLGERILKSAGGGGTVTAAYCSRKQVNVFFKPEGLCRAVPRTALHPLPSSSRLPSLFNAPHCWRFRVLPHHYCAGGLFSHLLRQGLAKGPRAVSLWGMDACFNPVQDALLGIILFRKRANKSVCV